MKAVLSHSIFFLPIKDSLDDRFNFHKDWTEQVIGFFWFRLDSLDIQFFNSPKISISSKLFYSHLAINFVVIILLIQYRNCSKNAFG